MLLFWHGLQIRASGVEGRIEYITHEMVQAEAEKAEERIATLITELISSL
ncbi:MAG: hypothetical protein IPN67_18105 [Bacteroidales bacterium]|nr:hypothetical protein [Bacteroidales bacterium]